MREIVIFFCFFLCHLPSKSCLSGSAFFWPSLSHLYRSNVEKMRPSLSEAYRVLCRIFHLFF